MARTLEIGGLPSGMTLTVDVTPFTSDVLAENISVTESATRKTVYTGTISTVTPEARKANSDQKIAFYADPRRKAAWLIKHRMTVASKKLAILNT